MHETVSLESLEQRLMQIEKTISRLLAMNAFSPASLEFMERRVRRIEQIIPWLFVSSILHLLAMAAIVYWVATR